MPMPALDPRKVRAFLERAHKAGAAKIVMGAPGLKGRTTLADVAGKMRCSRATLQEYLYQHARRLGWDWRRPETWDIESVKPEIPLDERERARYQDRIKSLQGDLRRAHRDANAGEDLRQACFGLARMALDPPRWSTTKSASRGGPGVPMLFVSDLQWGEVIRAPELGGINEYNLAIARSRYELLIAKTIELAKSHMVRPTYPGIVYLRGGDMVSGDIHQELRETNEVQSIPQVRDLVEHEIAGIEALLAIFPEVWVISVPGNHGRTTLKPHAKRSVETNFDTLSAWMIEMHFRAKGEKRVRFYIPSDPDAIFKVFGWTMCLTHGDRIGSRGGTGFIGAAATIARGMKKVIEYYAALGTTIDWIFVGHFHEYMELPWGFCNGSLPGISEYARDGRFTPRPPQQLLVFVHPRYGITARWPILLESRPRLAQESGILSFGKA